MNKHDKEAIEDMASICVYGSGIVLLAAFGVILYLLGAK